MTTDDTNPHAKKAEHLMGMGNVRPLDDTVVAARAQVWALLALVDELAEMNRLTGELLT